MRNGKLSRVLVFLGIYFPYRLSEVIQLVGEKVALGSWYKRNRFTGESKKYREELIQIGLQKMEENFTYLEFGVAYGYLTKFVSDNVK